MKKELQEAREEYTMAHLGLQNAAEHPLDQFKEWFTAYRKVAQRDYNAMVLSTASPGNRPSSRVVLLKGIDKGGFEFFTNYTSAKGRQIDQNPYVALNFYWPELERQVRIEGCAERISAQESEAYFNSRPAGSRIGAIASPQSEVIDREELEKQVEALAQLEESELKRPENWGGYRVMPNLFEFWQGRESRLHDRIQYLPKGEKWIKQRLAP